MRIQYINGRYFVTFGRGKNWEKIETCETWAHASQFVNAVVNYESEAALWST